MTLTNVWHLRKVADTSSKPCDICFRPTTSVLITTDNKDHFYICPGHLKDRNFATPIIDEADAATKKKEELEREIEAVKKEYEEKMKRKKQKPKDIKQKEEGKEKAEAEDQKNEEDDAMVEKEKDEKIKAITSKQDTLATDGPRIFALQKIFFQKRIDRIRSTESAKRNRERLKSPNFFPSVPSGNVG